MPSVKLEFYFDCTSPWTYLAFVGVLKLAEKQNADLILKPILVGGIFNQVNKGVYEERKHPNPLKKDYGWKDLQDWASLAGLTLRMPTVFPAPAVDLMRGAIVALDEGKLKPYAKAAFHAYWTEDRDISQHNVIVEICNKANLNSSIVFQRIQQTDVKDRLRKNGDELISRGGFGSPTFFVETTDMYFGNDRLLLVERAIERERKRT
ncbi:MAG: 2-hydroxychromene-2-carboxylate isomerase [Pseudomonadota bacterium]